MPRQRHPYALAQAASMETLRRRGYHIVWSRVRKSGMAHVYVRCRLRDGGMLLFIRPDGAYIGAMYVRRWQTQALEDPWQSW